MVEAAQIIDDVLDFWFGPAPYEPRPFWFLADPAMDLLIHDRFCLLFEQARDGQWDDLSESARGTLALIIILDQFPRNLYRGDARSFQTDPLALALAKHAVHQGYDQEVDPVQRVFFYLPFEHAEDLAEQETCLNLCKPLSPGAYHYAVRHHAIIEKFGRFPHRNEVLGRLSTAEELEHLKDGNPFG